MILEWNFFSEELATHDERFAQHVKGINEKLADLKTQFSTLAEEHETLTNKFKDDIESLEAVFMSAAKSSK